MEGSPPHRAARALLPRHGAPHDEAAPVPVTGPPRGLAAPPLERRLLRLERQNRQLRWGLLGAAVLFGACAGVQAQYERIRVRHLEIADANDRVVATLDGGPDGVTLTYLGSDGQSHVVLDSQGLRAQGR